jgi:type VI secretion system secreted protein VgrG
VGNTGNRGGGRSNHLVFDDTAKSIQVQLRSDEGASQLSMGSITRIEDWQGRQDARGVGFELRTDAVGAIRSGKGMLVSTESRPGGRSHIADVREPVSRLANAHSLHDELGKLAQKSGAQEDSHDQGSVADALQTQVEGIKGGASAGSHGNGSFPELSEPHLVLAGERGLQATTPATAHVSGGDHVALTAGQNVSVAAGGSLFASVVDKISLFAQRAAIRVSAAMGDIILHAISSSIKLESAKSIQLLTKVVQITGVEKLELHGGKTRLVLDDSGAQIFTPGKFVAFAASHSLPGPQDAPVSLVPKGICIECMLKAARGGAALLPR